MNKFYIVDVPDESGAGTRPVVCDTIQDASFAQYAAGTDNPIRVIDLDDPGNDCEIPF